MSRLARALSDCRSVSLVVEIVTGSNNENAAVYFLKGATSEKSPRAVVDRLAPQSTDFSLSLLSTFIADVLSFLSSFFRLLLPVIIPSNRRKSRHLTLGSNLTLKSETSQIPRSAFVFTTHQPANKTFLALRAALQALHRDRGTQRNGSFQS